MLASFRARFCVKYAKRTSYCAAIIAETPAHVPPAHLQDTEVVRTVRLIQMHERSSASASVLCKYCVSEGRVPFHFVASMDVTSQLAAASRRALSAPDQKLLCGVHVYCVTKSERGSTLSNPKEHA